MIVPKEIRKSAGGASIKIVWPDGALCEYSASFLRDNCRCAACRSELTGERLFPAGQIPKDVTIGASQILGNYALSFAFSDGHSTGIYSFDYLRELCPSGVAAK